MTDQKRVEQMRDGCSSNHDRALCEIAIALYDLRDHLRQAFSAELPSFKIKEKDKLP